MVGATVCELKATDTDQTRHDSYVERQTLRLIIKRVEGYVHV